MGSEPIIIAQSVDRRTTWSVVNGWHRIERKGWGGASPFRTQSRSHAERAFIGRISA